MALLFGLFLAALLLRSSPSGELAHRMRCVGRLRKRCLVSAGAPLLTLSLLTGPAESSRVRARAFPLRLSASAPVSGFNRHPPPPNNSFKPTPCRGVGRVLYATLAHVRRPATGRLNSSVRRQKAFDCFASQYSFPQLRLALLFGRFHAALFLRSSLPGALTHCMR